MAVMFVAALADLIAPYDPLAQRADQRLAAPDSTFYFGTDGLGRDVLSRVIFATRTSLYVGLLAVGLASLVGITIGMISSYHGGAFDLGIQRIIDILLGFPFLVLAVILVVALTPSSTSVAVAVAVALTPQVARVARSSGLRIKDEPYVLAARLSGASALRIVWSHLLPNSLSPILVQITGYFGTAVAAETALSFLGLGVPPPFPSWGRMLQEGARQYLEAAPWTTVFPGLALSMTVLSSALLGDGVRDLLDARRQT